jgi:hypothetical protein
MSHANEKITTLTDMPHLSAKESNPTEQAHKIMAEYVPLFSFPEVRAHLERVLCHRYYELDRKDGKGTITEEELAEMPVLLYISDLYLNAVKLWDGEYE